MLASFDEVHVPLVIVHLKVYEPFNKLVKVVEFKVGLVITTEGAPRILDHAPFSKTVGVLTPGNDAEVKLHKVWLAPIVAVVG